MKGNKGSVLAIIALLAACGVEERVEVAVSLVEFSVTATPDSARAGRVSFEVRNDGEDAVHEFVVVRTDLTIPQLPTNTDGSFDEEGTGVTVIKEIDRVRRNETRTLTLTLDAGHYVLLCNIVMIEDGEVESHFAKGMRTDFNVY